MPWIAHICSPLHRLSHARCISSTSSWPGKDVASWHYWAELFPLIIASSSCSSPVTMLLRSSSTPSLGAFNSLPHQELDLDCDAAVPQKNVSTALLFLSPVYPSPSQRSQHATTVEEVHVVPHLRVPRANSESDSVSLRYGLAIKHVANSFLGSSSYEKGELSSNRHRHWSKRRLLMKKNGWSFLTYMKSFRSEGEDFIPEETKTSEARNNEHVQSFSHIDAHNNNCYIGLEGVQRNVGLHLCGVRETNFSFAELGKGQREMRGNLSSARNSVKTFCTPQEPSVTGRIPESFMMEDGEVYTSFTISADGVPLVCNGKGCRPVSESEKLSAMYIASGLGLPIRGRCNQQSFNSGHGGCEGAESNSIEPHYERLLQASPENPLLLRNFAQFLHEVQHDYKRAEEYYERAILAGANDGEVLLRYAKLVWDAHRDQDRANSYFDRAVQAAPDDCYVLASYASFLWESEENEE